MRYKKIKPYLIFITGLLTASTLPGLCYAQVVSTEEKFQDLFVSAGYGTAYGATLGAALLSFKHEPQRNLRFIALGASVGFICGSLLGSYIIISPVLADISINTPLGIPGSEFRSSPQHHYTVGTGHQKAIGMISELTVLKF